MISLFQEEIIKLEKKIISTKIDKPYFEKNFGDRDCYPHTAIYPLDIISLFFRVFLSPWVPASGHPRDAPVSITSPGTVTIPATQRTCSKGSTFAIT